MLHYTTDSREAKKSHSLADTTDRISDLPDSIIHHILSFLPSTKEAIQTGILSKRWRNQWSWVPVLIFDFRECDNEDSARLVDDTLRLYNCSKIKKFHFAYRFGGDTYFTSNILFAAKRNVEELLLDYGDTIFGKDPYMLPESIFDNASLVELRLSDCGFKLSSRVNWPSLKVLRLDCYVLKDISGSIENVLSGSPSLESLELSFFDTDNPVTIASKSLKILNFVDHIDITHDLEISCPNLEVLSVLVDHTDYDNPSIFHCKTLLNVLSGSLLLHSLELNCYFEQLVIASKSLKKLVLYTKLCAEISCPHLEKLVWDGLDFEKCKLINLPASCCATLDFETPELDGSGEDLARKILVELQQVKELEVQNWFIKVLSALKTEEVSNPLLVKYLTLNYPNFEHLLGILNTFRCSPVLERLVIKLHIYQKTADLELKDKNSQIPEGSVYANSVYHLKTVKTIGLSKKDIQCKAVLCFVAVLLKNARALEKMTVILEDDGKDFPLEVSRILLGIRRC